MQPVIEAYLDIETTGLSPSIDEITVIGIHLCNGDDTRFIQLVGEDITAESVTEALSSVEVLYTYNGSRFDNITSLLTSNGIDFSDERNIIELT